jgi:ADP-heptose:LPS heptosyltransferase
LSVATSETFLVFRTDKIGDLVLSLPVAEALKEARPGARVAFVVSPGTSEIARACPFIDDVIDFDEAHRSVPAILELARALKAAEARTAVFLRPTFAGALAARIARVPARVGTSYRYYSLLFNRRVREHRRQAERHEIDYNLGVLAAAVELKSRAYTPKMVVPAASRDYAARALAQMGLRRKSFVIIHPGSAGSARNLPAKSFARLADIVEGRLRIDTLVTAGPADAEAVREMTCSRKIRSRTLIGAPSLLDLAGVLAEACVFISGSTGPMHVAAAVGTPTISFFSPARTSSPRRWQPTGAIKHVIMPPVPECPRCVGSRCEYFDCMERIDVDQVVRSTETLLATCR